MSNRLDYLEAKKWWYQTESEIFYLKIFFLTNLIDKDPRTVVNHFLIKLMPSDLILKLVTDFIRKKNPLVIFGKVFPSCTNPDCGRLWYYPDSFYHEYVYGHEEDWGYEPTWHRHKMITLDIWMGDTQYTANCGFRALEDIPSELF